MDVIERDPEGTEIEALQAVADLEGRRVLEIGAGNGRLTWRYAHRTAHVTAIEPDGDAIASAERECPSELQNRISFQPVGIEEFKPDPRQGQYEVVLLSWSL